MKPQLRTKNKADVKVKAKLRGCLLFPQVNGKRVESVELWLDSDCRAITVWFQDRTCLHFNLECDLAVKADYFNWRSGEQRVIKRWPQVRRTG